MKRIINTIKYGSAKVKAVLFLILVSGAGTLALLICAILWKQILFLFAAIACAFVMISLIQTLDIQGQDIPQENKTAGEPYQGKMQEDVSMEFSQNGRMEAGIEANIETNTGINSMEVSAENHAEDEAEVRDRQRKGKKKKRKKKAKKSAVTDSAGSELQSEEKRKIRKKRKNKKQQVEKQESAQNSEEQLTNVVVVKPLTVETVDNYDRKRIRKAMHRYKVKRDHRMILIDRSEKLHISQTPAYMWVEKKMLHLLLIEQEPRHIEIPVYQLQHITYLKKQYVNEDMDYAALKGKSLLAELFRPYLPDYTHSTVVDDLSAYKNLYGIGNDIFVTNRSAAALFDLLGLDFEVDDRVTTSGKVNIYFKDVYKANIMLRDNVIDANGYADRISKILDHLAHSTVSYAEFKETLNLLIRNKLITQEFATYYMGIRDNLTK